MRNAKLIPLLFRMLLLSIAAMGIMATAASSFATEAMMTFEIRSTAFENNAPIPAQYTCNGTDISPPLSWSGVPDATVSLALIVDDPDAPDPAAPKMIWVHWVLYNLPASIQNLDEAVSPRSLPSGSHEGKNDWQQIGYRGPCPPIGRHRYFFKLYALDALLPKQGIDDKPSLLKAMQGHILASAELIGTYQQ